MAIDVSEIHRQQVAYFESGATLPRAFRLDRLKAFQAAVAKREKAIAEALHADLRKNELESYAMETSMVLGDCRHAIGSLDAWMTPSRSLPPVVAMPSVSRVHPQPIGPSLVLGAWNYPFQLGVQPLVGAIAAGCPVTLKPSELSPATSALIAELVGATFSPEHIACVEGGIEESQALLKLPWAHFFYTGGTNVGRLVAHAAAEHLARCTLELGGKSPAIIAPSANLDSTAMRLAWGKWSNAGQTCIAPDYVLCVKEHEQALVHKLKVYLQRSFGEDPQKSPDFGRIVNDRHFERVRRLIEPSKVAHGGTSDAADRYIAPTILTGVTFDDAVMKEEIFGPILPILTIDRIEDAIGLIRKNPNPLALYLFTERQADIDLIVERVSFGGGCVNNTMFHVSDANLPFGGIGTSGQGSYHGKAGFDAFTHYKSVLSSAGSAAFDLPLRYPPYAGKLPWLKKVL